MRKALAQKLDETEEEEEGEAVTNTSDEGEGNEVVFTEVTK